MRRSNIILVCVGTAIFAAALVFSVNHTDEATSLVAKSAIGSTTNLMFPPSFLGHPVAYAAALFGQLIIVSFSVLVLLYNMSALKLARNMVLRNGKPTRRSLINIYRLERIFLMAAVLCGTGGNLLTYLTWGEVNASTMVNILTAEKTFKFIACIPFMACMYLLVENEESHAMQLSFTGVYAEPIWPIQPQIKDHIKTVVIIFIIAILVTFGKASGLGAA